MSPIQSSRLPVDAISSVLICRINGRLGNTVLLTALVKRIHELFPHQVSGLIQEYLGALRRLRAQRYDLALDPIPESTGGRVALTLCRTRYRVGFLSGSQWGPLTHAIAAPGWSSGRRFLSWSRTQYRSNSCHPLFCASDPVLYGPLKPMDLAINIAESTPRLVAQRCRRSWRESIGGNSARH
jgi:hypothetical protein